MPLRSMRSWPLPSALELLAEDWVADFATIDQKQMGRVYRPLTTLQS